MNLPQLIEYIVKNDLRNKMFTSDSKSVEPGVIYVSATGAISTQLSVYGNELFTIEVEEEITEDTVFSKLIERWKRIEDGNEIYRYIEHENTNINKVLFINSKRIIATHFYAEIDGELKLIWRDGKLVE